MREGLLEVGKRRKSAIRKGRRIVTVITEIIIGNGVRGGIGEEIGMMMIITEIETLTGSIINQFKLP